MLITQMNMYEGDDLIVTDATCPNRLKVKKLLFHSRSWSIMRQDPCALLRCDPARKPATLFA